MILTILFALKSKRRFEFVTLSNFMDICIFTVFATRIYLEYQYYVKGLSSLDDKDDIGTMYYDNIFGKRNDEDLLDYMYSIGSACLYLRIIMLFRLTRFLGPLIKMIQNMINDIIIFMVLFVIQLIVFATIATLLFASVGDYASLSESLKTLFSAALGTFDFNVIGSNDKSEILGDAFLVVFIILNMILLLNLLIAILSSTYAQLEDKKLVLYINEILKLRNTLEYDKN